MNRQRFPDTSKAEFSRRSRSFPLQGDEAEGDLLVFDGMADI